MRKLRLVACSVETNAVEDDEVFYSPRDSWDVPDDYHRLRPRRSFHRAPLASSLSFSNRRRSFCYDRLQQFPVRFTVVKLDGSRFDIEVRKSARIADLKQAVERAFDHMSVEPDKISWQHVWGHFCLCYGDQKLVKDERCITYYGMREGDELRFVHHVPVKNQKGKRADIQKVHTICDLPEAIPEEEENESYQYQVEDEAPVTTTKESISTSSNLLRKFLLHSRPVTSEKGRLKDDPRRSKISTGFMGCLKSMFQLHGNKTTCTPTIET